MQAKKIGCFLGILLLFSAFMGSVHAAPTTVIFSGGGVTVDLTYPEEAHPNATITHNVTITAHTALSLQSFTLFIYAPVNASWQEVKNRTISWDFLENETLTSRIEFQLPQDANGTLYCVMTVQTDQAADVLSYEFYTTHVSILTFSEMQSLYNEMLANYTSLVEDYNGLLDNYSSLLTDYETLLSQNNALSAQYASEVSAYETQKANYTALSTDYGNLESSYKALSNNYNSMQSDYASLNSTRNNIQGNCTLLDAAYKALNQTYVSLTTELNQLNAKITQSDNNLGIDRIVMFVFVAAIAGLIGFIIYLKRKQAEPYVVIRKETVAVKQDEKPKE
jgi:archaellum component FlaC